MCRCAPEAGGEEPLNGWTPLHLCCQWGLKSVVATLLKHGAAVNSKVRLFRGLLIKLKEDKTENIECGWIVAALEMEPCVPVLFAIA